MSTFNRPEAHEKLAKLFNISVETCTAQWINEELVAHDRDGYSNFLIYFLKEHNVPNAAQLEEDGDYGEQADLGVRYITGEEAIPAQAEAPQKQVVADCLDLDREGAGLPN